jgi:hypothetical protein
MKQFLFLSLLTLTFVSCTPMAHAEKFYFYKEEGKKLPKGQRYDSHYIPNIKNKLPGGLFVSFALPGEPRDTHNELTMSFSCVVDPRADDQSTYLFFIEDLGIRDGEGEIYPLQRSHIPKNLIPVDSTEYKKLTLPTQRRQKVYGAAESVQGKIQSKYELDVYQGESYNEQLTFNASELPKHLFIDYTFRIRKDGEETPHILKGTIPLERASYHVSFWEKIRY